LGRVGDGETLVLTSFRDTIGQETSETGANMDRREWSWLAWVGVALLLTSNLPYVVAWAATPGDAIFTGLIFNPQDGNSYVAKMRQGYKGFWQFRLPYTPEPHDGAAIYLYHLLLGHFARWAEVPLIIVYHSARILGGMVMLMAIYCLACTLSDDRRERRTMFLLTSLGSGLGWLAAVIGTETADLWVSEAFPVYSLLANAHFPLAIGLMAGAAVCGLRVLEVGTEIGTSTAFLWGLGVVLLTTLLGIVQPFGLVPVFGGLGVALIARAMRTRLVPWRAGAWIVGAATLALPYPLYTQLAINSDPVLAAWGARNVTPSPPLWDWALSYGLVLVMAVPGSAAAVRRSSYADLVILGWALATLFGMVLPLPLQRRLSLGLGVPMGLLGGLGWWRTARRHILASRQRLLRDLAMAFSTLTSVFLMILVSFSALSGEPWFYLSSGEEVAFSWLREHGAPDGVVLCAPQTGAFIPAWAGQPVVYGHPFETVDAERRRAGVVAYWLGTMDAMEERAFLRENRVRFVMVGPRERLLGKGGQNRGDAGELVLETQEVRLYAIDGY
jgi:hypothetical protein